MANDFSASFQTIWAKEQQIIFYKQNVAMQICDTSFDSSLKAADKLNRTYRSSNAVAPYVRGTPIVIDMKTDTNEQLIINLQYANGFYVDDFDQIQDKYDIAANYGKDNGIYLSNQVDSDVLGEAVNAYSIVDSFSVGGTATQGIALTTSNVLATIAAATKAMQKLNVPVDKNKFGVISPEFQQILIEYGAGRDTTMGDKANEDGSIFDFYGYRLWVSNQTLGSGILGLATEPTDGDTVTIMGQVFTFKTVLGTTPGNVLIGGSDTAARTNLAALINAPTTTTAQGVALVPDSDNERLFLTRATAIDDDVNSQVYVQFKGVGVLNVSSELTDTDDGWISTQSKQHLLFGIKGNPVLVMQRMPSVQVKEVPNQIGKNILNAVLYGVKTFQDNAKQMVDVQINSSTY